MISRGWWTLIAILFILSLALRYDMLFLFTILLSLASGASMLWFRYCLHGVSYRRKLKDSRIFFGEETELAIEVTNAKPLPLAWLLIRDEFPRNISLLTGLLGDVIGNRRNEVAPSTEAPSEARDRALEGRSEGNQDAAILALTDMLSMRWYERVQRIYRIRGERRGVYEFGPAHLASGDIFGFGDKQIQVEHKDRLVVYPKVVPIEQLGLPSERPAGELSARRKVVEDPLRMATVREYMPGDSIRHIHWKNTARLQKLQTKVFDPNASPVLNVFVDLQTAHNPYSFVTEYLELILSAAASVALHALSLRYAVGLYANGGPRDAGHWTVVPAGRSPGQGTRILEALAPLTGFRLLPLHQFLRRAMPALPFGSTVLAVTARATEPVLATLLAMQDAGHPVVLLTVGEAGLVSDTGDAQEAALPLPDLFPIYHLGGRDAWHRLEALELA